MPSALTDSSVSGTHQDGAHGGPRRSLSPSGSTLPSVASPQQNPSPSGSHLGAPEDLLHQGKHSEVCPLLMDYYQLTMAYAYWRQGKHLQPCVFEASFRRPPFQGSFAVLGGVRDVVCFLMAFRLQEDHIAFIREQLPTAEPGFFDYLRTLDGSQMSIRGEENVPCVAVYGLPLFFCSYLMFISVLSRRLFG